MRIGQQCLERADTSSMVWNLQPGRQMDEMKRWLEGLSLGQYAQAFTENDIDFDVLPDLSEAELERLGVSLGHRKRLQRFITAVEIQAWRSRRPWPRHHCYAIGGRAPARKTTCHGDVLRSCRLHRAVRAARPRRLRDAFARTSGSAPKRSAVSTALSRNIWAMAFSPISDIPYATRVRPTCGSRRLGDTRLDSPDRTEVAANFRFGSALRPVRP